jgi:chromosome segregation ATPase
MYIEEVCIDGFKSYAKRTVVPGFDPLFNAITGLNGSGKSNILDSICFVLGISNLTHVRTLDDDDDDGYDYLCFLSSFHSYPTFRDACAFVR